MSISFNAVLCLLQERFDGWLNDEVQHIFIDFINTGFTTHKFPKDPPLYAVNIFEIIQLFKYGEYSPFNQNLLNIYNVDFEKKLKNSISNGSMVSSIAIIMEIYKLKPKHHLTKFF